MNGMIKTRCEPNVRPVKDNKAKIPLIAVKLPNAKMMEDKPRDKRYLIKR